MGHLKYLEEFGDADDVVYYEDARDRLERVKAAIRQFGGDMDVSDANARAISGSLDSMLSATFSEHDLRPTSTVPSSASDREWFDEHVARIYARGSTTGRQLLRETGITPVTHPGIENTPTHRRARSWLYASQRRWWNKLTDDLRDEVSTTARSVIADGDPLDAARSAALDRFDTVGDRRATLITQGESSKAFNRGMLTEYEMAGAREMELTSDWDTAGDHRVCATCATRSGEYTPREARNLLEGGDFPPHPGCRCLFVPRK